MIGEAVSSENGVSKWQRQKTTDVCQGYVVDGQQPLGHAATGMRLDWGQHSKSRCWLWTKGLSGTGSMIHAQRVSGSDLWRRTECETKVGTNGGASLTMSQGCLGEKPVAIGSLIHTVVRSDGSAIDKGDPFSMAGSDPQ